MLIAGSIAPLAGVLDIDEVAGQYRLLQRGLNPGETVELTVQSGSMLPLMPVGARIDGPAILAQPDTTILIEPGYAGEVDRFGNVLITPETP